MPRPSRPTYAYTAHAEHRYSPVRAIDGPHVSTLSNAANATPAPASWSNQDIVRGLPRFPDRQRRELTSPAPRRIWARLTSSTSSTPADRRCEIIARVTT